jgi:antitoxin (DNA-binding transcriptional repressor) of toxin-antitoxin stability system
VIGTTHRASPETGISRFKEALFPPSGDRVKPQFPSIYRQRLPHFRNVMLKYITMKRASIRDLRYGFKKIERLLLQGEEIQITKRRRVIARLVSENTESRAPMPDFLRRLEAIYGDELLTVSGAELIAQDRSRY